METPQLTLYICFLTPLTGDWIEGVVPGGEDFLEILLDDYGKYIDSDGNLIEGREDSYKAYLFHVDRILPSVNADITRYHGDARCQISMSATFKITDEAFALLMVVNYFERWVKLADDEKPKSKKKKQGKNQETEVEKRKRQRELKGKYTSSSNGCVHGGWDQKGITHYNELSKMIKDLRKDKAAKDRLDEKLKDHWKGIQEGNGSMSLKRKKPKQTTRVEPFVDDDE